MSSRHLDELRKAIEANHGTILAEEEGDDLSISGVWVVRNQAGKTIHLVFEGMGDLGVLPIEKSYACYIDEDESQSLYFRRIGRWRNDLTKFVEEMLR